MDTATRFEQYLEELGDVVGDKERRAEMEIEFRRALGTLVRHSYESARDLLQGHHGIELVHETLVRILHDGLEVEPGSLMRLVSSVGHRLFRSRAGSGLPLDDVRAQVVSQGPHHGPHQKHCSDFEFTSLDDDEQSFLHDLLNHDRHKMGSGRIHFEKLARELGISTKVLRGRLRELIQKLGRGIEYQEFWFKRLAEATQELYRIRTEEELGDLLGSRLQTQRRLRLVLCRLKSFGAASSLHLDLPNRQSLSEGLRLLRLHQRDPVISFEVLAMAAELLGSDRLALALVEAERLRALEDATQALALLTPWRSDSLPPRRALLLRLARARCLERLGRPGEASDQLEACHSRSRNDPLFQYNRFVLARLSNNTNRAQQALHSLRQGQSNQTLSPLLLRGIRLALDLDPE